MAGYAIDATGRAICKLCGIPLVDRWFDSGAGGYKCRQCGTITTKADIASASAAMAGGSGSSVAVRSYKAKNPEQAAGAFAFDSAQMAAAGFYPTSQSWAAGSWPAVAWLLAILLLFVFIIPGVAAIIFLIVSHPDGTLTVTYQQQAPAATVAVVPPPPPPAPQPS